MKGTFYVALVVAFIDYIGIGLIFPLFSAMLFDPACSLLSPDASHQIRGFCLGLLLAIMPLTQFFSAPIWGGLSDGKGRKKPLQLSLAVALAGYLVSVWGIYASSFILIVISRIIIGFAAGNMAIVQATIADLSPEQDKAKNFGLYNMATGAGFTLGPFFGGGLATWGYSLPFLFATVIVGANLVLALLLFKETHFLLVRKKLSWAIGITNLKKAFKFKELKTILLCFFIHSFSWAFFFEFVPLYFIKKFEYTSTTLGFFYGAFGAFYALSTGLLIRPLVKRFVPEALFFAGNFLTGFSILAILLVSQSFWIWPLIFIIAYFVGYVAPTATTLISNRAPQDVQGEALGVLSSVNAAALVLSSLFSGSIVGAFPSLCIWAGGVLMIVVAFIILAFFRKRLLEKL